MTQRSKRIFGLDLLRAIAILLVFISHTFGLETGNTTLKRLLFSFGITGVELFFVLSGFLIGAILIRAHNEREVTRFSTIRLFLIRRWFRTLPGYYLVILFYNILYFKSYGSFVFGFNSHVSFLFFLQNFFNEMPEMFFLPSWSLCVEEWFYLLFPVALFVLQFIIKNKSKLLLTVICSFICLPVLLKACFQLSGCSISWDNGYRKIVPFRLDAIGWGILLAYLQYYHHSWLDKNRKMFFRLGFLLGLFSAWITFNDMYNNFFNNTFLLPLFSISAFLIIPVLCEIKSNHINKYFVATVTFISLTSYAVYLLNSLVIFVTQIIFLKFHVNPGIILKISLIWTVTFLAAYIQYRFFETRITALRDRFGTGLRSKINRVSPPKV
jgi:peptidoglycan/LPS O-acetylase OafA/YrhL